jgi:hypothetical protein
VTGSGANPANGADFVGGTLPSGTLTFNAGETSKVITVNVAGDTLVEPDEGFTVTLSDASNAQIVTATATGTILNDDATAFSVTDVTEPVGEHNVVFVFEIRLSQASALPVAVDFATADGTAVAGDHYLAAAGELTFAPGVMMQAVEVTVLGGAADEQPGTFQVNLSRPRIDGLQDDPRLSIAVGTGTGTIVAETELLAAIVPQIIVASHPTQSASGFFDVLLQVPEGVEVFLAGYDIVLSVTPANSELLLTGAAEPVNAVLPSQTPFVRGIGTQLQAADNLPGVGQDVPVVDGQGLIRVLFQIAPAVEGTFQIAFEELTLTDANANPLAVLAVAGQIEVLVSPPPRITDIQVSGAAWTQDFAAGNGYSIPTGPAQLDPLPWTNLNRIAITFSENVNVELGHLNLFGVSTAEYAIDHFGYDPQTCTATWTLASAVAADKLRLHLSDDVTDMFGNRLDGEWTDAVSTKSGDGIPGGDFMYRLNVVPGDVNGDNRVRSADVILVRNAQFAEGGPGYSIYRDVNGDGRIRSADVILVRNRQFSDLPGGDPQLPQGSWAAGFPAMAPAAVAGESGPLNQTVQIVVGSTIIQNDPDNPVTGFFDVLLQAPEGVETLLAAYDIVLSVIPGNSGLSLTGGAEPANAVFPGQTPFVADTGNRLLAADNLPNIGQEVLIIDGQGLIRVLFEIEPGVEGVFQITFDELTLNDGEAQEIPTTLQAGTVTVQAPPPQLSIAATDAVKPESDAGTTPFVFTVTRTGNTSGTASVQYAVTGSGAYPADEADFKDDVFPSGTVEFAADQTAQTITIEVVGDTLVEPDEGFTVTLSNASSPATITTAAASGTILNDDSITLAIAATDAEKPEGDSGTTQFTFTVTRSGDPSVTTTVDYAVTGSGANPANAADFDGALPFGTVTFAIGETSQVITVDVSGDTMVEPDEGFTVTLSNASSPATITTAAAAGTILNDDSITLAIAATDAEKPEGNSGNTPFTFTVTRSGDASVATTVDYAVTGSGANPADAADFGGALPSGTVTFAVGETSQVITVDVSGDTAVEPDEGFTVTLSDASGPATITTAAASGTILNDDSITLAIAATDAEKPEGDSGTTPFTFTVTRSGDTSVATTVDYAVTGSVANPANAADFGGALPFGRVTFAIGETSQVITVDVSSDTLVEPDEGFTVTLSNASSPATITTAAASGTILNDDSITVAIAATDAEKPEGDSGTTPFTFTVTRSGDTSVQTTVEFAVTGSEANPANAADFGGALPSGTVTFPIGETSQVITIDVSGDTVVEPDEGFTVTLSNASSPATITTAAASGTILNDDSITLAIAPTDAEKPEGNAGKTPFTFTVTRSGDTSVATTVDYAVTGSGANPANAADFAGGALPSGTLTFNASETSRTITVEVAGDTTFEADEAFTVTLSNASNAQIVTATATGTILNDDLAARLTLEVQELDVVAGLSVGETFLVLGRWADLSQAVPRSIYAGYADISFDSEVLRVESIEYSAEYPFGHTGSIDQDAGLVDEAGAISGNFSAPPDNDVVFVLRVTALASGSTTIASAAGQAWSSEVVLYGDEQDRRLSTEFGSLTVQIAAAPTWHNAALPWDVDGSGTVTPLDVLELINYLNSLDGGTSLPSLPLVSPRYYDVNGDGQCSPLDVLMVINHINTSLLIGGESEIGGVPHGYAVEEPISMDSRISALDRFGADTTQGNKLDSVFQNSLTQADPLRGVWPHAPVDLMEAEDSPLERTASREQEDALLDALLEKATDSWLADSIDAVFAEDWWR